MAASIKDAALELIENGLSVIPIRPGTKRPCCEWEEFQKRIPTEDEVEAWFEQWPNAQLALVTGRISGVVVIDLDSKEATQWAKQNLPPPGAQQRTGAGWHLFYASNGSTTPNRAKIREGIDVRGDGGYVLIDPSIHPDRKTQYKLDFKPYCDWDNLPEFPRDFLPDSTTPDEKPPVTLEPAQEGERNDRLARIAGQQFALGLDYERTLALCKGWNADLDSPLPKEEVERTVHSIWKRDFENSVSECQQMSADVSERKQDVSDCQRDVSEMSANVSRGDASETVSANVSQMSAKRKHNPNELTANSLHVLVEDWVKSNTGKFQVKQLDEEFNLKTRAEKNNRSRVLKRLADQGLIRKEGNRTGEWRIVTQDSEAMDIFGTGVEKIKIPLPLGVSDMVNIYPGSIIVIAGTGNSGKSAMALNFAYNCFADVSTQEYHKERREEKSAEKRGEKSTDLGSLSPPPDVRQGPTEKKPTCFAEYFAHFMDPKAEEAEVHMFNSEMAAPEMRDRLEAFPGGAEAFRKVHFWKRSSDFADAIRPNGVNIIDYMEVYDEFWKIGQWINEVHKELNKGIAVIVLQKKMGAETGRGGELTIEKPRLYLNLENNAPFGHICKIAKAKSFVDPHDNPNGKEIDFKLINGVDFMAISPWRVVKDNKEREKINNQHKRAEEGEKAWAIKFRTKTGKEVGLNFKDLDKYKKKYPHIDVEVLLSELSEFTYNKDWMNQNWIHQMDNWLAKKEREVTGEVQQEKSKSKKKEEKKGNDEEQQSDF